MAKNSASTLTQLGRPTELPASPDEARLETVPNPHPDASYLVRFTCPEFTSLCPVTGQPDFAHLVIDYVPERAPGREQVAETVSRRVSQPRRVSRGLHADHRPAPRGGAGAACGCASAATGIRAAACRSTCSTRPARRPRACGCPIRACRPIGRGLEDSHPDTRIVARGPNSRPGQRTLYRACARSIGLTNSGQAPLCTLECAARALNSSQSWSSGTVARSAQIWGFRSEAKNSKTQDDMRASEPHAFAPARRLPRVGAQRRLPPPQLLPAVDLALAGNGQGDLSRAGAGAVPLRSGGALAVVGAAAAERGRAQGVHPAEPPPAVHPVQRVPARPLQLPVLRRWPPDLGADLRSPGAALARRHDQLGQRGHRVHRLQSHQGQPPAARSAACGR